MGVSWLGRAATLLRAQRGGLEHVALFLFTSAAQRGGLGSDWLSRAARRVFGSLAQRGGLGARLSGAASDVCRLSGAADAHVVSP